MKLSGGPTLGKFVGHEGIIQGMAISKDDKFFVSSKFYIISCVKR